MLLEPASPILGVLQGRISYYNRDYKRGVRELRAVELGRTERAVSTAGTRPGAQVDRDPCRSLRSALRSAAGGSPIPGIAATVMAFESFYSPGESVSPGRLAARTRTESHLQRCY